MNFIFKAHSFALRQKTGYGILICIWILLRSCTLYCTTCTLHRANVSTANILMVGVPMVLLNIALSVHCKSSSSEFTRNGLTEKEKKSKLYGNKKSVKKNCGSFKIKPYMIFWEVLAVARTDRVHSSILFTFTCKCDAIGISVSPTHLTEFLLIKYYFLLVSSSYSYSWIQNGSGTPQWPVGEQNNLNE